MNHLRSFLSPIFDSIARAVLAAYFFLLPTQFGKHFFMEFSYIDGVRVDYLAPALYVTDILFLALCALYWRHMLRAIRTVREPLGMFVAGTLMQMLIVQHPLLTLYGGLRIAQIGLAALLFSSIHVPHRLILLPCVAGAITQLGLSVSQLHAKSALQGAWYFLGERALTIDTPGVAKATFLDRFILRPYGTFSHPNSLGGFYALLGAWGLSIRPTSTLVGHARTLLLTVAGMLVLVSFSKTAIVACVCALAWWAYGSSRLHKHTTTCTICHISKISIASVVVGIFLLAQGDVLSLSKRLLLAKESLIILLQSPILGTGFGHHLFAHTQFPTPYPHIFIQPVHNVPLLFMMQAGIPLGGYVFYKLCTWGRGIWKARRRTLMPILIVLFITGLADHYWLTLQQNMLLVGTLIGISIVRKRHIS